MENLGFYYSRTARNPCRSGDMGYENSRDTGRPLCPRPPYLQNWLVMKFESQM
ncbi:hypothetical protein PISMIDRAFT_687554 [Pisolithus microcarpus 441]|uniref:Uncharacterized protein n=1 Tax=Pisolithus microcarpus 441 TaxID=765257 RepID=A0A0C9Z4Y2_9AGAM|nr:hypothetical protein PISMIDRAFT_687554 [Pisolithus microcarpus 441]